MICFKLLRKKLAAFEFGGMSPRRRPRIVSWIWRANAGDADLVHDVTESRRLERSCRFVSSLIA